MLTLKRLKEMEPDTIFAYGSTIDSPDGCNMTNSGKKLFWVACRGDVWDWAIYVYWEDEYASISWNKQYTKDFGDKVSNKSNILRLVRCSKKAFKMYRY